MYINFWYPLIFSHDLGDEAKLVRVLDHDFAVYRTVDGKVHCLANTCVHRGGNLADGRVRDGNLECPYHGWQFDGGGACKLIPSMGAGAKIPGRAKVDSYPVEERFGIIFAFLGDLPEDERPPIMEAIEYDDPDWYCNLMTWDLASNYTRSIENGIDPGHNEFVHPTHGFSGEREGYFVPELNLLHTDWGVGFMTLYQSSGSTDMKVRQHKTQTQSEAGSGTHGPNAIWTYIHISETAWFHQYMYEAPIDDGNVRIFLVNMRSFGPGDEMAGRILERNKIVAQQDIDVLEPVKPVLTPKSSNDELMVPADSCVVAYRKLMKGWHDKGWHIDRDKLQAAEGKKIFAIPSPARRETKGWVLDAVPTAPAK